MAPLVRKKLTLPADFIDCSTCLARIERLISAAGEFADVTVDFETGRTTIEYPQPEPVLVNLIASAA
jgi:hypothetical protein